MLKHSNNVLKHCLIKITAGYVANFCAIKGGMGIMGGMTGLSQAAASRHPAAPQVSVFVNSEAVVSWLSHLPL